MKPKRLKKIVREFKLTPEMGAAALLVGSSAEGLPFKSLFRKGNKIKAIYSN